MKLHFLGGAGTVTGSKYLFETESTRVLIDCGLFQGLKSLRLRNRKPLPIDPSTLDGVVLTHAHLDHSGYLPVLTSNDLRAPIYASAPTRDLLAILLRDSGYLQEEDARYANKKKFSKHDPALPLYTEDDGIEAANRVRPVAFDEAFRIGDVDVRLRRAGHILGAASVELRSGGTSVLFSGDLGRADDLLMKPPVAPGNPDFVVMESTYGDRLHEAEDAVERLGAIMRPVLERGGVVMIPSFAVGRAQLMLYCLHQLFESGSLPQVPVYVNSPMATDVTRLYVEHFEDHRLDRQGCAQVCGTARFVASVEESKDLNRQKGPMVIISASGMLTGGRILHHLKSFAPDENNAIILPGFQAAGTRGDALKRGKREVKIHGRYVPVRCEVVALDAFSAHADRDGLTEWVGACRTPPRHVYLVHGEPTAADSLRAHLADSLGFSVSVAELGEIATLTR